MNNVKADVLEDYEIEMTKKKFMENAKAEISDKMKRHKNRLIKADHLYGQKWGHRLKSNRINYDRELEELKFLQLKDQYRRENEMEYLTQTPLRRQIAENSDYNAKIQYIMKHYETQMNGPSAVDTMIDMFYKPAIAIGAGYLTSIMASEFVPMSVWGTLVKAVGL